MVLVTKSNAASTFKIIYYQHTCNVHICNDVSCPKNSSKSMHLALVCMHQSPQEIYIWNLRNWCSCEHVMWTYLWVWNYNFFYQVWGIFVQNSLFIIHSNFGLSGASSIVTGQHLAEILRLYNKWSVKRKCLKLGKEICRLLSGSENLKKSRPKDSWNQIN